MPKRYESWQPLLPQSVKLESNVQPVPTLEKRKAKKP